MTKNTASAYFRVKLVTAVKSFVVPTPVRNFHKISFAVNQPYLLKKKQKILKFNYKR